MSQQFYLTNRYNPIRCYHTSPEGTWEHYRSWAFRLFNVISRTLVERVLPLCIDAVGVFSSRSWLVQTLVGAVLYLCREAVGAFSSLNVTDECVHACKTINKSSSSSCHAISTDIPDPFSPPFSIVHCFRQVFRARSRIGTELLYVGSSWSSCLCSSMWRGPQDYITYKFVLTSPAVCCMSGSSNVCMMDGRWPYSCCFMGFNLHDSFKIARSILA